MSKYTIRLNYNRATGQADRLDTIADQIRNMAQKEYEDTLNGIANAWKGENANEYLRKARTLRDSIEATADDLGDIADEIRRKAYRIYQAEMAALEIATTRSYSGGSGEGGGFSTGGGNGGGGGGGGFR